MLYSIYPVCIGLFLVSSIAIGSQGATETIEAQKHQNAKNAAQNKQPIVAFRKKVTNPEQTLNPKIVDYSDTDKKAKL